MLTVGDFVLFVHGTYLDLPFSTANIYLFYSQKQYIFIIREATE